MHKYRGSDYVSGEHEYEITSNGIAIYPRIEALLSQPTAPLSLGERMLPTGIGGLDEALGGGFIERSAQRWSLVPPVQARRLCAHPCRRGTGRTWAFWFVESPEQLLRKSGQLELGLESRLSKGVLTSLATNDTVHS